MLTLKDCKFHHSETEPGYRDWREPQIIEPYEGKYGKGFKIIGFSTLIPFEHDVKYMIAKGE